MESSNMQFSSTKRNQLHPKKQVNLLQKIIPPKTPSGLVITNNTPKLQISSHMNWKPSLLDSSPNKQNIDTIEIRTDVNSSQGNLQKNQLTQLGERAISDSMETNQIDRSINIETMKFSLKQKLDMLLPDSTFNKEPIQRISLARRRRVMEQKMRKFYVNASLPTTIIRNVKESNYPSNLKNITSFIQEEENETDEHINQIKFIKDENLSQKVKTKPNTKIKEANGMDVSCITPKKDEKILTSTKKSNKRKRIDTTLTVSNKVENNDQAELLIKKVIISSRNSKDINEKSVKSATQQYDAVIEIVTSSNSKNKLDTVKTSFATNAIKEEIPKCLPELEVSNETIKTDALAENAIDYVDPLQAKIHSTSENYSPVSKSSKSTINLRKTEGKIENALPTVNLEDTDKYVACLQTVKPSTESAIKAIASIRKLTGMTPEKIRETSENILDYNIEIINLVNKLTKKLDNSNSTNEIPLKVSTNKLEHGLLFALRKKPRTITLIRKPKDSNNTSKKLNITYIDRLDSALNSTLGNNSKLLPFVKKLINSSVSNFLKTNQFKEKSLEENLTNITTLHKQHTGNDKNVSPENNNPKYMNINKENASSSATDLVSKVEETSDQEDCLGFESSDIPKNQNGKFMNALNKFPETITNLSKIIEENRKFMAERNKLIKSQVNDIDLNKKISENYVPPVVKLLSAKEKNINIISMQKCSALKSGATSGKQAQINRKHVINACGANPIILRRTVKTNSTTNTSDCSLINSFEKLPAKKTPKQTMFISEASNTAAINNNGNNFVDEIGVTSGVTSILKRTVKMTQSNEKVLNNSNLKKLSIIGPAKLLETTAGYKNCKPIIIKRLIKKPMVEQRNLNAVKLQTNVNTHENIKTTEENVKASNSTVYKPEVVIKAVIKNIDNSKQQFSESINLKTQEEISHKEKTETVKRKFIESFTNEVSTKTNQSCLEQKPCNNITNTNAISFIDLDEKPPLKRPKTMSFENKMINVKSFNSTINSTTEQLKTSNDMLKTIVDFSSLQSSVQAILESDIYKQIILNASPSTKLDKACLSSLSKYEIKGFSSFAVMHEIIVSILGSPGYQQILTLTKGSKKSLSTDELESKLFAQKHEDTSTNITGTASFLPEIRASTEKNPSSLFDPNTIDLTTLKLSSTVPDALLPLLDKEENEEVYERYIIEHVWNENKNQDLSFFQNLSKK